MFDKFREKFIPDDLGEKAEGGLIKVDDADLQLLFDCYGGLSFNDGLYRIIHPEKVDGWNETLFSYYPDLEDSIICFAFDWAGNIFALDKQSKHNGKCNIIYFDVAGGEILRPDYSVSSLHDGYLYEKNEALDTSLYRQWRQSGGAAPAPDQCVGLIQPLFLGGKEDDISNFEICDLEVYWHFTTELAQLVDAMRPASKVSKLTAGERTAR